MGTFWRGVLKGAVGPRDNDSRYLLDVHRRDLPGEATMRRYADDDEVDLVVVGAGAGGSVLAQRLARKGWRVVILEAGPFWHPDEDWVSDEAGSHALYWTQERVIGGDDPIQLGKNNSGRGVGGSMVHYAGYTPRFHPSDFSTFTDDGVGADWPLGYHDLLPHYEQVELELPVAGQDWPWGHPHRYPFSPHPVTGAALRLTEGAHRCGIDMRVGPVGIVNGTFGNRPHCIYRGYCLQGCKVNAKASPYVTHLPDALEHGVEVRANCMALRVEVDDATGAARGVVYVSNDDETAATSSDDAANPRRRGTERLQRAKVVAVAGYSIETPRLLLASTSRRHPHGLGNNTDQVGRYVMVQGATQSAGRWPDELRMYKAPPPEISSEQFYETDPDRGFARGFSIQTVSPMPIGWAEHVLADGHWGRALREYMRDYNHWATIGVLNELLPHPENRITLADETDPYGQPVARMDYTLTDNDKANMAYSSTVITKILEAAEAQDILTIQRFAHLIGGARMGSDPDESVVDADHRIWNVPNVVLADGSVCPTQGSANPALTIMALASRLAERMAHA
ncbi:GMC family oxidoreductase [Pseudonocardia sp. RS11V-5]|uniref:GMC family oxidoreductase n=1 Tax=Pseudonocardia terrae TaxID=2905831 RepID=UPI001E2CE3ED|nr:GMC family oxidoreductase [Pseudonocardia terrae]MCE3555688.1 GMC family oxidoreductase [Pseudonocardia terrae]